MASRIQTFCDAMAADLIGNVAGLAGLTDEQVHLYLPVPEEEVAQAGERHLGVWIVGNTGVPFLTETHDRTQTFLVSVWEAAAEAGARVAQDADSDLLFTELAEDIEDRFYQIANEFLGGTEQTWLVQVAYGSSSVMIRRVSFGVTAKYLHAFA